MRQNDRCHGHIPLLAKRACQCYYELLAMTSRSNHSTGRRPRGLSWPHPRTCHGHAPGPACRGAELERRLIELGFVEGADVELLHQGLFGGDPIAVRVAHTTIALRRREAMAILVTPALPA